MDRNAGQYTRYVRVLVALRKESVDRNPPMCTIKPTPLRSLSARRAWIEMFCYGSFGVSGVVALRKESVDRNMLCTSVCFVCVGSLSARRAWIEILPALKLIAYQSVALRKESVDRNTGG